MTSRSGRGRWERVIAARRQAASALGRDPNAIDPNEGRPKARTPLPAVTRPPLVDYGPGVAVLSPGEAAARLGITRDELMAMVAAGTIKTLPTEFTPMIPTSEVVRLTSDYIQEG
jgi:hypothetical protein